MLAGMMLPVSTELLKIAVEEVSGVDEPANLTPGWLFQKSLTQAVEGVTAEANAAEADADLTVTPNEAGAVRRFLAGLRKQAADTTHEEDAMSITKEELLEILDARDARMAKAAADEAAAASSREAEIRAEAERLVAQREEDAKAEAERVAAEAEAAATAETEAPAGVTLEAFNELSDRVESLVKALTGDDGDGGMFATVRNLAKASAQRASLPEPTSEETSAMAKAAAGAAAQPNSLRSMLREARNTGRPVVLGADPEAR